MSGIREDVIRAVKQQSIGKLMRIHLTLNTSSMLRTKSLLHLVILGTLFLISCGRPFPPGSRLYVTNEVSGDLSVIDTATRQVIATVPLGKRPRGIQFSRDGMTAYVALSG